MEVFSSFSMVGVYETRKGLKFVHVTSEVKCLPVIDYHSSSLFLSQKFVGKFTILIFMDNRRVEILNTSITDHHRLSELEAGEWRDFSEKLSDFKAIGAQVGLAGSLSDIRLDFAHCAGGRGVHGQPCHRQDDAHELRRAEGAAQLKGVWGGA